MLNSFKFMRAPSTHVHILQNIPLQQCLLANHYIQPTGHYTLTSTYHFADGGLYRAVFFSPGSCERLP